MIFICGCILHNVVRSFMSQQDLGQLEIAEELADAEDDGFAVIEE